MKEDRQSFYHGSVSVIGQPVFGKGNVHNDYGLGFYCTENRELAREWACNDKKGGFVNVYQCDTASLSILDLSRDEYTILNWLAILVNNRTFSL
jgi:hypothetical protein